MCYKNVTKIIISVILFFIAVSSWGATYHYVNPGLTTGSNNGNDWTNAWKTFGNINWATLQTEATSQPVYLYVKKGSTSTAKITVGGSGSSNTNRIIVTTDPTDTGANPILSNVDNPIRISSKSYVTIQNLEITGTSTINNGVDIQGTSTYITIDSLAIHDVKTHAVKIAGTHTYIRISNSLIYNIGPSGTYVYKGISGSGDYLTLYKNTIYNVCEDIFSGGGIDLTVDGNDFSTPGWGDEGTGATRCANSHPDVFQITGSGTTRIINNYIHDTPSQGLYFDYWNQPITAGTILIYNNVFSNIRGGSGAMNWDNGDGQTCRITQAIKIYNNTFYNNPNGAFTMGGSRPPCPVSVDIKNNLMYGTGAAFGVLAAITPVTTSDYNLFNGNPGWGGIVYSSLAAWQAATSQDAHSKWNVDPLFVNVIANDFHLKYSSPAKDAGTAIAEFSMDKDGNPRGYYNRPWDIGAYEYNLPEPPRNLKIQ